MATPGTATRQKTTAETLCENQDRIAELEAVVTRLEEAIENEPRFPILDREESLTPSNLHHDLPDMPNAKVRLPNLFTGKLSEYAPFMAQCSLVFAAHPCAYAMDE